MTEPTRVTDMQAMLYWVECSGDNPQPARYRMFLAEYADNDGQRHVVAITRSGPEELELCEIE